MTKKEIEAYRANFEYGRKCWAEFAKEFPPDKPFPKHDKNEQRVFGEDPFAPTPKPKPVPVSKPEPKPATHAYTTPVATVHPKQRWQDKEIGAGWFWIIVLAVCAFLCFPLL